MTQHQNEQNLEDTLWVLTKLKNSIYAIDSSCIEGIFQLDQPITQTESYNDMNLGIIPFRGSVLPLIDLRVLYGMTSFAQEELDFDDMLEHRKQDHINWVNELKRCLETGDTFRLATDPHKCAFGKWYDNYVPISQSVAFHLRKLDEPHQKLHASAIETLACERHCDSCNREECLRISLKQGADLYMPQVVKLLDEAREVFRNNYRRMIVAISSGDKTCGLVVDEVISVESLSNIISGNGIISSELITHVAQRKQDNHMVLIMNPPAVLSSSAV